MVTGMLSDLIKTSSPVLMGIVNVTPDSFSDGGRYFSADKAIAHGLSLHGQGAAILDIGGESTRPGSAPVSVQEEIDRVLPVLEGLRGCGAFLSIDTRHAKTMEAALGAGAALLNDITAFSGDAGSLSVAARSSAMLCLMHMNGQPQTMQDNPHYDDVFQEVYAYLEERIKLCETAGIGRERIMIDPGIGFGKTVRHNLILLNRLGEFSSLGCPLLLGASRKRFIAALCPESESRTRLPGSLAAVLSAYDRGARLFRVHDVAETAQALKVKMEIDCA